jgi:hypothetical protein
MTMGSVRWMMLAVAFAGCGGDSFDEAPGTASSSEDAGAADAIVESSAVDQGDAPAVEAALPDDGASDALDEKAAPDAAGPDGEVADVNDASTGDAVPDAPEFDQGALDAGLVCNVAACPYLPGTAARCCTDTNVCGYVASAHCYPLKVPDGGLINPDAQTCFNPVTCPTPPPDAGAAGTCCTSSHVCGYTTNLIDCYPTAP